MAHGKWCGKPCCDCGHPCRLDESMLCSPDCENLTPFGKILVKECLGAGCEEIKRIFGMTDATDREVLDKYGEMADINA